MATRIHGINLKFPIVHEKIQSIQNSTHRQILASTEAALRLNRVSQNFKHEKFMWDQAD